jgi:hypothetical protein
VTGSRFDERTLDALARAFHQAHVDRAVADRDPDVGRGELVAYEDLAEDVCAYNRRLAGDVAAKLEMIGAAIVPLSDLEEAAPDAGAFRFTAAEVERLSRQEHARWAREKRRAGWRYGSVVDPIARTHPCLVGYDRLPEGEKDKDRLVVDRIPGLLREVGLGIVRVGRKRPARSRSCRAAADGRLPRARALKSTEGTT